MKKLILALILALVVIMTFSTPVLAHDGDDPGNMPGNADDLGPWNGLTGAMKRIAWGWGWGNGNGPPSGAGWGIYVSTNHAIINVMEGDPPAQPYWAGGP